MTQHWTIGLYWNGAELPSECHVDVQVNPLLNGDLSLRIDAPYHGDPPPDAPAGSLWQLWEHEVVELFLVGANGHYLEAEFGPHGHHLLLQLSGPRQITAQHLPVDYEAEIAGGRWQGRAVIARALLPESVCKFNLFAISGAVPNRRHLAWSALPGETPDFHQPAVFPSWPWA